MRIIKRRMMSVVYSSGHFSWISIWILVNGTMWTRMPQQLSDKMRAKSSTFSFARSDVYG